MGYIRKAIAVATLTTVLGASGTVRAGGPMLEEAVGLPGLVMYLESGAVGMVLGAVQGEAEIVVGYGDTAAGSGKDPDGKSLVRLGSLSKAFVGEVLAGLVAEGRVALTAQLQEFAPPGLELPKRDGRAITLLDLATHTAALPRELPGAPTAGGAPFAAPTMDDRFAWLASYTLPWAPGSVAAYSNTGFDLLAAGLATASGTPYPDLLRELVTQPLGMVDTTLQPSAEQCARLMTGYGIPGASAEPCVPTTEIAGSGGVYSTASDMVRWLRHQLAPKDERARATLALAHAPYRQRQALDAAIGFDEAGPMQGIGLAWLIMTPEGDRPLIVQKTGALPAS